MASDKVSVTPEVTLGLVRDELDKLVYKGASHRSLATAVSCVGELERMLRKLRVQLTKAIVEGASQGALPL